MKSLSRNIAIALFFAFVIGSIYGCAEKPKPITFSGPGVQIWKMNIVYENGMVLKDQTLLLKPSETEKDVFHVTGTMDTVGESDALGKSRVVSEWKGEIRNGMLLCEGSWVSTPIQNGVGRSGTFAMKGTFSKRRASGTSHAGGYYGSEQAKWTAEKISRYGASKLCLKAAKKCISIVMTSSIRKMPKAGDRHA